MNSIRFGILAIYLLIWSVVLRLPRTEPEIVAEGAPAFLMGLSLCAVIVAALIAFAEES